MKKHLVHDEIEMVTDELYIGTDREIRSLYRKLEDRVCPAYFGFPKLAPGRIYGIYLYEDRHYLHLVKKFEVVSATTCLELIGAV